MPVPHHPDASRWAIDALSIATIVGTLADVLPAVAALLSIVWTCIRIYETNTVQRLLGRRTPGGGA